MVVGEHLTVLDGESFGRLPSLTHQIRELIHDYPEGIGIVKELAQNADDAEARTLHVVIDPRHHSTTSLPSPAMAALQGPAILFYNDSTFTDDDFDRIQEIYRSGKVRAAEKTGQFGKGFNTVYNVTDWPGFVSRDRIAFFDPHGTVVHKATRERPGRSWRLEDCWKRYPDLLRPFTAAGLSLGETDFQGTIFRLPFRSPAQSRLSEISKKSFGPENLRGLLRELVGVREELLLFLKNLESLRVVEITPDRTGEPRELLVIETANVSEVREAREELLDILRGGAEGVVARLQKRNPFLLSYRHEFLSRWTDTDEKVREEGPAWRVVAGLALDEEGKIAEAVENLLERDVKAVPLGGAAARLDTPRCEDGRAARLRGKAYCSLPLPVDTGLPVHLNGFFDLDSSRHALTTRNGLTGNASIRARWNELLIEHVVARTYARLIEALAADLGECRPKTYYGFWPAGGAARLQPFDALAAHVYRDLGPLAVIRASGKARFAPIGQVKVLSSGWGELTEPLVAEGSTLPDPPLKESIVRGFEGAGVSVSYITPVRIREVLRRPQPLSVPLERAPRASLQKREWVEALLRFCLSDEPKDIAGLPLAVTSNGLLRTFGAGPSGEPLYLAGAEEREIFEGKPEWFIDEEFGDSCGLGGRPVSGLWQMGPAEVVEWLPALLPPGTGLSIADDEPGAKSPRAAWLVSVYLYLTAAVRKGFRPKREALQKIALVPDQGGLLQRPGFADTPLLCKDFAGKALLSALESFGVPLVTAPADLFEVIASFAGCCQCDFVWKLTGPDLVDTLATLDAEALPPFDRTTYGPVLDYLAHSRWRAAGTGYTSEQTEKLKGLRIFPTVHGELVSLDGDALIPGEFNPPPSGTELTLLDLGYEARWRPLLAHLGVPVLARASFIEEHLLQGYERLSPEGQFRALRWLHDNLNRALSEREEEGGDAGELLEAVSRAPLIRCEDEANRPAAEVYDPTVSLIRDLFGRGAAFPDQAFYAKGLDRWLAFFRTMRMVDRPRAGDLLRHIDRLVDDAEQAGVSRVTARLVKAFQYLDTHWAELREVAVEDSDGERFADALRGRAWLPAERSRQRLRRWPGAALPELRLYRAEELYLQHHANLVASEAPVLSVSRVGTGIRDDLGFPKSPPLDIVLAQFDRLVTLWGSAVRPAEKAFEGALTEVYRYLARFAGKPEESRIRERFAGRPCLWQDGKLWRPVHAFRARVPYFGERRVTVAVRGQVREAYQLLGLRPRPELGDFLEHLDELFGERDGRVLPTGELTRLLTLYHRLVQEPGYDDPHGRHFPLLSEAGRLVEAEEAFYNDAPWFAERIQPGAVHLLHSGLPAEFRRLPWMRSLAAEVTERPVGTWRPSGEPRAVERAENLGEVVRSEEFRRGLARLINHAHGVCRRADLYWLAKASVAAVEEIRSELVVLVGGQEFVVGSGLSNHYFDPRKRAFFLNENTGRLMARHLAECIDGQLGECKLGNLSDLLLILECEPGEIDETLTQLRVRPLEGEPSFAPPEEDLADEIPAEDAEEVPGPGETLQDEGEASEAPWEGAEETGPMEDVIAGDSGARNPEGSPANREGRATPARGDKARRTGGTGSGRTAIPSADQSSGRQPATEGRRAPTGRTGERASNTRDASDTPRPGRPETETAPACSPSSGNGAGGAARRQGSVRPGRGLRRRRGKRRDDRVVTYVSGPLHADGVVSSRPLSEEDRRRNIELGDAAVDIVCDFERRHGRDPARLPQTHPGYDVESADPRVESVERETGRSRLIEVKGIRGPWTRQGVSLSARQFRAAREHGDRFWLYVVEYADDPAHAVVHPIRDPFSRITEFWFDRGWRQLADPAEAPSAEFRVEVGTRLTVEGYGPGTVSAVVNRGALRGLVIQLDSGGELKRPFNPRTMKPLGG